MTSTKQSVRGWALVTFPLLSVITLSLTCGYFSHVSHLRQHPQKSPILPGVFLLFPKTVFSLSPTRDTEGKWAWSASRWQVLFGAELLCAGVQASLGQNKFHKVRQWGMSVPPTRPSSSWDFQGRAVTLRCMGFFSCNNFWSWGHFDRGHSGCSLPSVVRNTTAISILGILTVKIYFVGTV